MTQLLNSGFCILSAFEYKGISNEYIGIIESVMESTTYADLVDLGDTNFPCDSSSSGLLYFKCIHDKI